MEVNKTETKQKEVDYESLQQKIAHLTTENDLLTKKNNILTEQVERLRSEIKRQNKGESKEEEETTKTTTTTTTTTTAATTTATTAAATTATTTTTAATTTATTTKDNSLILENELTKIQEELNQIQTLLSKSTTKTILKQSKEFVKQECEKIFSESNNELNEINEEIFGNHLKIEKEMIENFVKKIEKCLINEGEMNKLKAEIEWRKVKPSQSHTWRLSIDSKFDNYSFLLEQLKNLYNNNNNEIVRNNNSKGGGEDNNNNNVLFNSVPKSNQEEELMLLTQIYKSIISCQNSILFQLSPSYISSRIPTITQTNHIMTVCEKLLKHCLSTYDYLLLNLSDYFPVYEIEQLLKSANQKIIIINQFQHYFFEPPTEVWSLFDSLVEVMFLMVSNSILGAVDLKNIVKRRDIEIQREVQDRLKLEKIQKEKLDKISTVLKKTIEKKIIN